MSKFKKYMSLKRFGTTEVEGIEVGKCYIFPKLDGANASIWADRGDFNEPVIKAGSRNRELGLGKKDNAKFFDSLMFDFEKWEAITDFIFNNPEYRLYGEWLVPHTIKTYREDAWRHFYVFDVERDGVALHYDEYAPILKEAGIEYIAPIKIITNPTYEDLIFQMDNNSGYLIKDGEGMGEGIVIKNYDFINRYGRPCHAKIVSNDFKDKHTKTMGDSGVVRAMIEEDIAIKYVTQALCEKTHAKIVNEEGGWDAKFIPKLLNLVYYDLIREDAWEFVKEHKNPTINFTTLKHLTINQVKKHLPNVF